MNEIVYEGCENGFGDDYPAVLTRSGIRFPLDFETRFVRHYRIPDPRLPPNLATEISRFVDGSASVTLSQLEAEWSTWTDADRMDFCASIADLYLLEQPDLAEMLRFIVHHGNPNELSGVAPEVGRLLPRDEAFELLLVALQRSKYGRTANIIQAIASTKHSEAEATIRRQLDRIVAAPGAWVDAEFYNNLAQDAAHCIWDLLKLGAPPADFEGIVRRLSEHACERNREWCRRNFAKHYAWLRG